MKGQAEIQLFDWIKTGSFNHIPSAVIKLFDGSAMFNLYTIYLIYFTFEILGQNSNFITRSIDLEVREFRLYWNLSNQTK